MGRAERIVDALCKLRGERLDASPDDHAEIDERIDVMLAQLWAELGPERQSELLLEVEWASQPEADGT